MVEHIGSGGMAEVYKAYHPGLDRYVAIKVLHPFLAEEEDFLTRFQREARSVATFRHPNIVQVYDFDFDPETHSYYMVMEFVDGPNLKTRLRELGEAGELMPLEEAVHIALSVADALDYAHRHGMVHRDIKPANIMLTSNGQVILSDFGIARMVNTTTLTASGAMVGTPAYMAPEQGLGKVGDKRSDIYSLGVVLYQMVTGKLPFDADTPLGIVLKHINAPLTPPTLLNPALPPGIEAVITRALAKDPDQRYQSAADFAADLRRALAGEPITVPSFEPPSSSEIAFPVEQQGRGRPSRLHLGRRWLTGIAAVLVLALGTFAVLAGTGMTKEWWPALASPSPTPLFTATAPPTATSTPDLTSTYGFLSTQVSAGVIAALATRDALSTQEAAARTPTPSPTPTATPTPDLTATYVAGCTFDMAVIGDPPVYPRILASGQPFTKRWTVKNTGTCPWPEGLSLVYASGDALEIVTTPDVQSLSPGEVAELRITLRAPTEYGSYTGVWRLQTSAGRTIGADLRVTCRVDVTPTPSPTLQPTPTQTATPTPSGPLWMSVPVLAWCDASKSSGRIEWGVGGGIAGSYRYFYSRVAPEYELAGPYRSIFSLPHVETYLTVSGTIVWPVPADCCLDDYGRYVSPNGYEIVWYKIWYSADQCPK
ncbi:MAG: protein kinase [Anaerolineae bacterium]|nr:protein kinase [Anaerolineae bacterium]